MLSSRWFQISTRGTPYTLVARDAERGGASRQLPLAAVAPHISPGHDHGLLDVQQRRGTRHATAAAQPFQRRLGKAEVQVVYSVPVCVHVFVYSVPVCVMVC